MEPLGFGMQLPPSPPAPPPPPPADNTNQDLFHDTQFTMYFTQPPPPVLQPPAPPQRDQDFNRETQLTMYFTQPPPPVLQPPPPPHRDNQDYNRETQLTMYFTNYVQESPLPSPDNPNPQPQPPCRRHNTNAPREGKSPTIPPPFPWATNRGAQLHTLKYLTDNAGIKTISGDVQCKRCRKRYQIEYNLEEKFKEVSEYVANNKHHFNERAPRQWMEPILPTCNFCHQENSMKPVINNIKKRSVNWLFLLLGQMVGCCKLMQLRYFCKHTGNHRTGAKDRVLYLTYLELCKQLDPNGPYDRMNSRIVIIR